MGWATQFLIPGRKKNISLLSLKHPDWPKAHPASYSMGARGYFP